MAQLGLALYLIIATAAGPCLCCCSGDRLVGHFSAAKHVPTIGSHCCYHRAIGGGHHVPGDKRLPEKQAPHDSCPCRDGVPHPMTILVAKSSLNADFARSLALVQEFAPGVLGTADPLTGHSPAQYAGFAFASPLQNSQDILSVLQTLRC